MTIRLWLVRKSVEGKDLDMLEQSPDGSQEQPGHQPPLAVMAVEAADEGDDRDLTGSLIALSTLSAARLSLEDLLTRVASFAVHAIPGADGAGLTVIERDRSDTVVTSDGFVRQVETIQYGINEGPCITAAATGEALRSGSLTADPRWPRFGPRVGRLKVHSVLSLPLLTEDVVVGAINVYAHARDAFDDRAEHLGQLFAVPAAIAVQNAQILAQTQRLAANLQRAMVNRAVIDQAIGIIISRSGITPDQAFDRLRMLSQKEHIKVSTVATSIVDSAARRARGRACAGG
jgi:GAF domain-containing protein